MQKKKEERLPAYASRASAARFGLGEGDYVSVCLHKTLSDNISTLSVNFDVPYEELEEKLNKIKELFKQIW